MININLKIQKKDLWLLSAIVIFLVGVGYVIAYGSGDPILHGHDVEEIELIDVCVSHVVPGDGSDIPVSLCPTGYNRIFVHYARCGDDQNRYASPTDTTPRCDTWFELCCK